MSQRLGKSGWVRREKISDERASQGRKEERK